MSVPSDTLNPMFPSRGPRQRLEARAGEVFASQLALITRRQARGLGLSSSAVARRVHDGRWARVLPNVYRLTAAPETEAQRIGAAALWAGPDAAVSHRTALGVWGVAIGCDVIEVVTCQRRDPLPGILVHQVRRLPSSHLTLRGGVRVTTAERTLLDIAALSDPELLERTVRDFFDRRCVTFKSLRRFLEDDSTRGLPGRRRLHRALWHRGETTMKLPGGYAECIRMFLHREGLPEAPDEGVSVGPYGLTVPVGYSELRVAILPRGNPRQVKDLADEGWTAVCLDVKDLFADPEYCALEVASALARAGASVGGPRRKRPVWRAWLDWVVRMRINERVVAWRRNEWAWYDLHPTYAYWPIARRDWELAQCLPDTFSGLPEFRGYGASRAAMSSST